jgi:hypothetical protein
MEGVCKIYNYQTYIAFWLFDNKYHRSFSTSAQVILENKRSVCQVYIVSKDSRSIRFVKMCRK